MERIQDVMEGAAVLVEGIVVRRDAEPKKVNGLSNYVFVEIQDKVCGVSACTVHCHIRALRAIASRPDTGVVGKCPRCGSERVANKILVCTNSDCAGSHI